MRPILSTCSKICSYFTSDGCILPSNRICVKDKSYPVPPTNIGTHIEQPIDKEVLNRINEKIKDSPLIGIPKQKSKFIQIRCDDEVLYINIDTIKRFRESDEFKTEIITTDNITFVSYESIEEFIKRLGE